EGAYFNRSVGAPAYAGVFAAWCDLREVIPYAFGYMLAAKVGTGIVAELGAMRISHETAALEVMGVPPVPFVAATRLLAAWIAFPFMYLAAVGIGYFASWLAVVEQIGGVSSGGYFLIFWMFQNPPDLLFSMIKGMVMATAIVLVGCYYGYTASGGPVGVGTAAAKSMGLTVVVVDIIGMMGALGFWGANPRGAIGGMVGRAEGLWGSYNACRERVLRRREKLTERKKSSSSHSKSGTSSRSSSARSKSGTTRSKSPTTTRRSTRSPARPRTETSVEAVEAESGADPLPAQGYGAEAFARRDYIIPGVEADDPDPYKWHTGKKRDHGGEDAIEIIDLVKQFGRTRILNGCNMGIPDNMISMILGPSGTGKSVLIKHIVG